MNLIDKGDMETKLALLGLTENKYLVVMSSVDEDKDNGLKDSILKDSILYDGNNQDVAEAIFNREYKYMKCIILYSYNIYSVCTMLAIKEN